MSKTINIGDWIEANVNGTICNCKVLGFTEKGIAILDEWDEFVIEWRDIESIKVEGSVEMI